MGFYHKLMIVFQEAILSWRVERGVSLHFSDLLVEEKHEGKNGKEECGERCFKDYSFVPIFINTLAVRPMSYQISQSDL